MAANATRAGRRGSLSLRPPSGPVPPSIFGPAESEDGDDILPDVDVLGDNNSSELSQQPWDGGPHNNFVDQNLLPALGSLPDRDLSEGVLHPQYEYHHQQESLENTPHTTHVQLSSARNSRSSRGRAGHFTYGERCIISALSSFADEIPYLSIYDNASSSTRSDPALPPAVPSSSGEASPSTHTHFAQTTGNDGGTPLADATDEAGSSRQTPSRTHRGSYLNRGRIGFFNSQNRPGASSPWTDGTPEDQSIPHLFLDSCPPKPDEERTSSLEDESGSPRKLDATGVSVGIQSIFDLYQTLRLSSSVQQIFTLLAYCTEPAAALLVLSEPSTTGSDVWPDIHEESLVPLKYTPMPTHRDVLPFLQAYEEKCKTRVDLEGTEEMFWESHALRWPQNRVPKEMYFAIMAQLSRDDIKAMRLVCREFEYAASSKLFENIVVPFNTEVYGMLRTVANPTGMTGQQSMKGKGKARGSDRVEHRIWQNQKNDDIYVGHGISVFNQFGKHLKKFGMTLEVDEDTLAKPPLKLLQEAHTSYWGHYEWPYQQYTRFAELAGLENAADETFKMKTAFSFFRDVKELALSIDCGLGWLHGPDVSLHSRIIRQKPRVLGTKNTIPEREAQAQRDLWKILKAAFHNSPTDEASSTADLRRANFLSVKTCALNSSEFALVYQMYKSGDGAEDIPFPFISSSSLPPQELSQEDLLPSGAVSGTLPGGKRKANAPSWNGQKRLLRDFQDLEASLGGSVVQNALFAQLSQIQTPKLFPKSQTELLLVRQATLDDASKIGSTSVQPNDLTISQKEWLLEMDWAQRAFLSSYMLAVHDNRAVAFRNVETLNLARISCRCLTAFHRDDFWQSLPNLTRVRIHVIPDWRDVRKDPAGYVQLPELTPSDSQIYFWQLLADHLACMQNVRELDIGWSGGGEHETGLCARNKHLMPAPIVKWDVSLTNIATQASRDTLLKLPYVEHLTLSNCWITPPFLISFVEGHKQRSLKKLTLNSVSLTTLLLNNDAGNAINAGWIQNIAQQIALIAQLPAGANQLPFHFQAQPIVPGQQAQPPAPPAIIQNTPNALPLWNQWWQNANALQAANNAGGGAIPPPNVNANANANANPAPQVSWLGPHRDGSWPWVLDKISPGDTLEAHGSTTSPPNMMGNETKLETIELRSCGYARLPYSRTDQSALDPPTPFETIPFLVKRGEALAAHMLKTRDEKLADIVQHMPTHEVDAVRNAWNGTMGWPQDHDAEDPEAAEFDGCLPGGTGRFSATIHKVLRAPDVDEEMLNA